MKTLILVQGEMFNDEGFNELKNRVKSLDKDVVIQPVLGLESPVVIYQWE